jgi:hypothetical protein
MFIGGVLSLAPSFIVTFFFPDNLFFVELEEALYVSPDFIMPVSLFIGFALGSYKAVRYDDEKNS